MAINFYNEMHDAAGKTRAHYAFFESWSKALPPGLMTRKRAEADLAFRRLGITFAVYGEEAGTERLIPFDTIPRIIPNAEWKTLRAGLKQRVKALNLFLDDIYNEQAILRAGKIPAEEVLNNAQYRKEMKGFKVPNGIYAHIAGVDVVRAGEGEFYVLEDNLRVPSGVSYMLEDRKMMMRLFPELFAKQKIAPVEHYPDLLLGIAVGSTNARPLPYVEAMYVLTSTRLVCKQAIECKTDLFLRQRIFFINNLTTGIKLYFDTVLHKQNNS